MILPHIVVREMLLGQCKFLSGSQEDIQAWAVALLKDPQEKGQVVREMCLPALLELKDSATSSKFEKVSIFWHYHCLNAGEK